MKKFVSLCLFAALIMSLPASALTFKDMPDDHWAASAVYDLVNRGVTNGFPDGTFRGNKKLSRYETAVFLSKMAKSIGGGASETQVEKIVNKILARKAAAGTGAPVSGTVFVRYQTDGNNSGVINNFDVTRAYLTINSNVGENADAKVVLDSTRNSGTRLETFLKYAYVDLKDTFSVIPGITMNTRIGMQPTYWSTWVDGLLGLRVVETSMLNLDGGITTSDFGLAGLGKVNLFGLPTTNYTVTVLNGNGFTAAETDQGKNIAMRFDSEVWPGLTVAAGGRIVGVGNTNTGNKMANLLAAYDANFAKTYLEVMYGTGLLGVSAAGTYDLGSLTDMLDKYGVFARADIYDPNRTTDNDGRTRMWIGGTYDWNANVKLVADYDAVTYASAAAVNAGQTVSSYALRAQINL